MPVYRNILDKLAGLSHNISVTIRRTGIGIFQTEKSEVLVKISIIAILIGVFTCALAIADNPQPQELAFSYGCNCVNLSWAAPHPENVLTAYKIYRSFDSSGNWQLRGQISSTATTFTDNGVVVGRTFTYGVSAVYNDGESEILFTDDKYLPDPAAIDFLIVGTDSSQYYNRWYMDILNSLGLQGEYIDNILPYCGNRLASLPLLVIVDLADGYPGMENNDRDIALTSYLATGGKLYIHDGWNAYSDTLTDFLPYGYTSCIGYSFNSMHGVTGTFTEGLWYTFSSTRYSSNLWYHEGMPEEVMVVLEDDVQCGCVDLAFTRNGYKAVINSQPLDLAIDDPNTGTRLEYFRRMMEFFEISADIPQQNQIIIPDKLTLSAYPNPFNAQTRLSLSAPFIGPGQIDIYDITGRLINKLNVPSNNTTVTWDGKNSSGQPVSSGVYFARTSTDGRERHLKLTLLK
jgi:hypothetical protein